MNYHTVICHGHPLKLWSADAGHREGCLAILLHGLASPFVEQLTRCRLVVFNVPSLTLATEKCVEEHFIYSQNAW